MQSFLHVKSTVGVELVAEAPEKPKSLREHVRLCNSRKCSVVQEFVDIHTQIFVLFSGGLEDVRSQCFHVVVHVPVPVLELDTLQRRPCGG